MGEGGGGLTSLIRKNNLVISFFISQLNIYEHLNSAGTVEVLVDLPPGEGGV